MDSWRDEKAGGLGPPQKLSFLCRNERLIHHKSDFIFVGNDLYFTNLYWKNCKTKSLSK